MRAMATAMRTGGNEEGGGGMVIEAVTRVVGKGNGNCIESGRQG